MRIYSLQAPDGNIYDLQAPEGASEQQLTATLYSLKPEAAQPFVKESGVIAQGKKGIEQLVSGIQTTGGAIFGDKNEAARDALARQAAFDKKYEQSPSLERTAEAFKQQGFFSGLGQLASDAPDVLAAQIPQFGLSYAGGRTGAAAGSKLGSALGSRGRAIGALLGGVAGTVGASYPGQLAGNIETQAEEQLSKDKPIDINLQAAATAAAPQAALDAVANLPFFGRGIFGKMLGIPEAALVRGSAESVERLAKESLAATITKGTAVGFAAEFPTEIIQQAIQRYQAGKPLTSPEAYKEYGEIAYQTALLSPLGTAGRSLDKRGAKAQVQQKAYEEQQIADAEAQKAAQQVAPVQPQDIAGRYQAAEKRKAELKGQIRKVEEGSVTETADRLYNKELEDQIKEMAPELEQLATEYNQFQKTAPAPEAVAEPEITAPEEIKPTRALTVGDSLDNPLGRFTKEELTSRSPKIAAYVDAQRKKMGKPSLNDYSIEDIRDAMPGQLPEAEKADLNSLIAAKTGYTGEVIYKPEDVVNIAKQKNINTDAVGFKYFLQRATGDNDLSSMSQPQLHSAFKSLSELPKYEETQNLPEKSSATHYSPDQYRKAVDRIKSLTTDGILPSAKAQEAAKQASGLKRDSDVQYMLQSAYRNGDLDLDSQGNFIRVNPAPQSEFRVEEGFEPAEPTGFNVMRGDKVLFSTQNEAEAKAKAKTLGDSAAPTIKQVDKSIANEQKTLSASQRSLDAMEANGLFGTPEYNKASAKHTAMVEESAKKVGELNKTKEYLQQEVTVKAGKKAANVKAFTTKEKGVSEKSFATREEALKHAIENHTVARLNEIAAETKSPGLKARISKELERRKGAKPFLAAENPVQEPVQKPAEEPLVTAKKESIKSNLLPMLKKFGLGDVALQIEAGMKAEGSYTASTIKVALDATNPVRVLRHESLHGLKDLGFFTKGQWGVLENQADKVWIDKYLKERNIDGRPLEAGQQSRYEAYVDLYKGDMQAVREEAIADAFGDFDVNGAPKGVFTTLLNKMRQFFEALRNSFNGAGYTTSDDVFGKVERGELTAGKKAAGKERLSARELQKGIVAEVAPNPDQEIAEQWRTMSQEDKLATTKSVTNKVVNNVLKEMGLEGYKVEYSNGTYLNELNPNILINAPKNASIDELSELANVIGYVLDQKAMIAYDESNTSSGSQAGFVKVDIPKGMSDADLNGLRKHIAKEVPQADSDTLRGGSLLYGNFSEYNDKVSTLTDEQYRKAILDSVSNFEYDGIIDVSDVHKFHSDFIQPDNRQAYLEGTRYGTGERGNRTEGADVRRIGRSNLDNISTDAINLRNRWIESAARPKQPPVRPSRGSDEGISLGEKQKNALAFDGIHYGRSKTPVLMGSMSGSGLKGAEKDRLSESSDGRIKKRAYFYIERPDGSMPMVESGVGNQVHTQSLNNILGPGAEMRRISAASKGDFNKFESGVVDAGYDGYASPDMGMMVILNHDVPTTYQGTVADLKASGKLEKNRIIEERKSLRSDRNSGKFSPEEETISTRKPTSVNPTENPDTDKLNVGVGVVKEDLKLLAKHADLVRNDPLMGQFKSDSDEATINHFVDALKDNLLYLWNATPKDIRNRSKNWYKGANKIASTLAEAAGISKRSASGVLAALSPQTPWDVNVSQAARVITIWKNHQNTVADSAMKNWFNSKINEIKQKGNPEEMLRIRNAINGKSFKDVEGTGLQPWWLRAYDETHHSREYHLVAPEGKSAGVMTKKDGEPSNIPWGNTKNIEKALSILNDDSLKNISDQMGDAHKVRSFYNNIVYPDSPDEHVTIDTHAVAAARFEPLGAGSPEVRQAWLGQGSSSLHGQNGLYGEYAEAYRRAAKEVGVLPREMQSVTWEKVRGLFPDTFKTEKAVNNVKSIWKQSQSGKITTDEVRARITDSSPNKDPSWSRVPIQSAKDTGITSNEVEPTSGTVRGTGTSGRADVVKQSLRTNVTEDIKNMPNGAAIFAAINRTTQTRQEVGFIERLTEALAPESFSYLRQKGLDRYNRLSDVERLVAKKMGGVERLADSNAHAAALQSDLAAGVAASALGVGDRIGGIPVYKDGYTTVSNENGTIKGAVAIFAPLARYGDPKMYQAYQFWAASKRGKRLLANGKEELFTQQDFAYAKQLEQKYPEFVSVQKDWIKYNDGLVKYAVDTGVISAQNAAEFVKYSDYLPFYRQIDGERTIGPNIFQSISGVKAPKKITGSDAPLADFLETVVRNTQATIQAGMKNVAAKKAADAGVFIGMVQKLDNVSSSPNTITILEKGQKVSYECADRLWVDAVSSLNLPELPFLSIFAKPADLLRNLITKDPGFMLANLMRDSVSAYVTSGAKITPLVSTMKEFGSVLMNSSPEYQKLLSAGVLGGYEFSRDIEASTSEFAKDIRKKTGTKTTFETAASPFTLFWGALEKGTTASDAATRIAIYKATLAETGNEAEALHRSLEVLNFNRKGSSAVVRIAAAVIPFLNARVQGLDVFFRSGIRPFFNKDATAMEKQVQKAMFIRGSTIMAMSAMYAAAIAGNPDYEKQEEEVKDNNWIIPLGEGKTPLKIPIPFEVGTLFKTVPERIYRSFYGMDTNKDSAEAAKRALSNTFGISPLPQFIAPYYEVKSNYSLFTGREIVSGNMKDVAPEYQVGANTSKVAQELGMATGMSPMKLEYLYKGYTGTMGMYALDLLDASITSLMPDSGVQRASKRFEQMPVIKRFFADPEARGKITAYYDLKNSVDSVVRTVNFLEKSNDPTIAQYVEKNAMLYAAKDFINDLNKQMQDLQDQANMVRSADIPPDEKREILLEITKAQNLLVNDIRAIRKVIQP